MSEVPNVREVMAKSLYTLDRDMDIFDAVDFLLKHKISGAPVVSGKDELCGVLSEKDCLRLFTNGAYNQLPTGKVSDYMTTKVETIGPDEGLFTAADRFFKHSFRRLPVVENGKLIGQISRRDVLNGSRRIFEKSPQPKAWTDSKYFPDEVKAALDSKSM